VLFKVRRHDDFKVHSGHNAILNSAVSACDLKITRPID